MALGSSLATDQEARSAPPERFATHLPGRMNHEPDEAPAAAGTSGVWAMS